MLLWVDVLEEGVAEADHAPYLCCSVVCHHSHHKVDRLN